MVLFFITSLITSLIALSLMLGVKYYELSSGHLLFGARRERMSRFSTRMTFLFGTAIPHYIRYEVRRMYRNLWVVAHNVLAYVVLKVQAWLDSLLERVQEK